MTAAKQSAIREGVIAGLLGATAVAVWFFIIDLLRGDPLLVPAGLGHGFLHAIGITGLEGRAALVVAYTIVHYTAFIIVGIVAAFVLHRGEARPSLLVGAMLLLIVFEIAFLALSSIVARVSTLGQPGWLLVSAGNLIAALVMGVYLWRANPDAMRGLNASLRGDDDQSDSPAPGRGSGL